MGFFSRLFGKQKEVLPQARNQHPPEKTYAIVELRSPYLIAFELPYEGQSYKIPDFEPGTYKILLEAIVKATEKDQSEENRFISVDTGAIYFIDAEYEDNFRKLESQLFEERGDSYTLTENPEGYTDDVGIKFDCILAPGIGSGYDFEGDGTYRLAVSKIEKV